MAEKYKRTKKIAFGVSVVVIFGIVGKLITWLSAVIFVLSLVCLSASGLLALKKDYRQRANSLFKFSIGVLVIACIAFSSSLDNPVLLQDTLQSFF